MNDTGLFSVQTEITVGTKSETRHSVTVRHDLTEHEPDVATSAGSDAMTGLGVSDQSSIRIVRTVQDMPPVRFCS